MLVSSVTIYCMISMYGDDDPTSWFRLPLIHLSRTVLTECYTWARDHQFTQVSESEGFPLC